jgi:hypothetical protein
MLGQIPVFYVVKSNNLLNLPVFFPPVKGSKSTLLSPDEPAKRGFVPAVSAAPAADQRKCLRRVLADLTYLCFRLYSSEARSCLGTIRVTYSSPSRADQTRSLYVAFQVILQPT